MAASIAELPIITKLEQTFRIRPSTPVAAGITQLPAGDQVGVPIVLPKILCFGRSAALPEEHLVEALKVATADAIAELPHLCGKISLANEATRRWQLEIEEDASVLFRVRYFPEKSYQEYERLKWPPHMLRREELSLSKYPIKGVGTYNFAVQANMIQDGLILALHMSHIHFDGYAHALIESVFAHHLCRAIAQKPGKLSGIIVPEALDKSVAYGTQPARPILEWEDWRAAPPPMKLDGVSEEQLSQLFVASMANFSVSFWKFSAKELARIRQEGQDTTPGAKKLSLASCLHAYLWKAVVRARRHDPEQRTLCLTPVQTRGRIKEMHPQWSGSALVYSRAHATAGEVEKAPLFDLGRRLEKGVARWTPALIREYWGSIEACEDLSTIQANTDRANGPDVEFSNISNLPFHRTDWGNGLHAAAWRCTELAFTDGYFIVAPKHNNGDIEVLCYMTKNTLANLIEDRDFRRRAEYVCSGDVGIDARIAATEPAPRARL
ncbi:uncharacterized protein K489DRAFT_380039 [Dissoconium aciculare CBS 342.82]|jgi:hypothetical protein|uniref:Trichothecene 3-O-acetyltransferase n=1 Tax=Dissoconium aciculare CBS 342.82 TaxID=1314786 RepID=A0A6J3M576_9PEZI|nr:uncharacterized protein K489DRAFT_380039 [Dissoconium aciculare CBS 342.82]KAF1822669.1 hypothetical protein K489DRAFT_380039 [Dissoconium aciculare CBS 342.82]